MQKAKNGASRTRLKDDFLIEGWIVRPQLNRIEAQGTVIQVQPKVMAVLICLAEQPGQVVTKERLLQTVWADTHVTQHVLARSISELRKIFHDNPQSPSIIETIPKTGYRLIAHVSRVPNEVKEGAARNTVAGSHESVSHSRRRPKFPPLSPWPTIFTRAGVIMIFLIVVLFIIGTSIHHH
jgi:DNA-binding winged helix-turn-helix (wHTH) protein